jgi:Cu(I)/Ag(I) efflux system protein CusF
MAINVWQFRCSFFEPTRKEIYMNRLSTLFSVAALFTGLAVSAAAGAQAHDQVGPGHAAASAGSQAAAMSAGEVMKVDKAVAKITIKHGPLLNVGMPAMTMAFKVSQPAMIDQVNVGDKIHFVVEKVDGTLTVTRLEPAK